MFEKKRWAAICIISLITLGMSILAPGNASALKFLSFGTGSTADICYFLGAGFSSMINDNIKGIRVTAESTAASVENARLIIRHEMDLGLARMGTLADLKTEGMAVEEVRLIAVGHTIDTHWMVRKESPIQSIKDFKDKTIGVGPVGSTALNLWSKTHLEAGWGITMDDINPKYLSFDEVTRGLRDEIIHAGIITGSAPLASVMEVAGDIPIRIIQMEPEYLAKLRAEYGNIVPKTLPAGMYNGINEELHIYCIPQMWICRADLSEDLIYNIIKTVYDNNEVRNAIHPMAKMYTIENAFRGASGVPVEFHPGAVKYYKEKKIWDKRSRYYE